jgi:hypothetical protein
MHVIGMIIADKSALAFLRVTGANPRNFKFPATTPALYGRLERFSKLNKNSFQNALGYPWRCKN